MDLYCSSFPLKQCIKLLYWALFRLAIQVRRNMTDKIHNKTTAPYPLVSAEVQLGWVCVSR